MIRHESQRQSAGKGDGSRKLSGKEIDHRNGEGSEDQGDDSKVSFGFIEGIELMGENEEERRMKISRILFIEFNLAFEIVSGVIESMDFIHPKGFLIKSVKPQGKAYKEAEN